jgi:bifunctional non-homologous end joining protein LigD
VEVRLSSLDRVLWPRAGFTKGDMIAYYRAVAPALVPHLDGRPLTLFRAPSGVEERGWYQENCRGAPPWLEVAEMPGARGATFRRCVVRDEPSLLWVANAGAIELHPFPFRVEDPDAPSWLVLDLDPGPPATIVECCDVALRLRELLPEALPKTSGSLGLHLYAQARRRSFDDTKALARELAERLAAETPELVVHVQRREARRGKVLVDWLQNDATRSTVAPYSLRRTPFPTVSTPLAWDEVERCARERRPELLTFLPADVLARLELRGDLFAPLLP